MTLHDYNKMNLVISFQADVVATTMTGAPTDQLPATDTIEIRGETTTMTIVDITPIETVTKIRTGQTKKEIKIKTATMTKIVARVEAGETKIETVTGIEIDTMKETDTDLTTMTDS